ncbi:hypothetical protein BD770DRAFT_374366 [Pilaira anomala]|nr:hypothetical protein BD770DRAFT_374366 [Pilaira anomala]
MVNVQPFSTKRYSHKIQALPFKLPREEVNRIVNDFPPIEQPFFYSVFNTLKSRLLNKPDIKVECVTSLKVRKAYIPLWYYDIAISANITPSIKFKNKYLKTMAATIMGPPRQILGVGLNCFWPGHTWDPICYLNCSQLESYYFDSLVPFTPKLYENSDIEVIPFTVNPFKDLSDRVPKALENLQVNSSVCFQGTYKINSAQVLFHAAYPIYWPVYVVEYIGSGKKEGDLPTTIVLGADNAGPLRTFKWDPKWSGVYQWKHNNAWTQFGVTEPEWRYKGFLKRNVSILEQLSRRYLVQVVGNFQTKQVNWEDNRILSYTGYRKQNKKYLIKLFEVWIKRGILSRMETMFDNQTILVHGEASDSPGGKRSVSVSEHRKEIRSKIGNDLEELKQREPAWYKKYKNKSPSYHK